MERKRVAGVGEKAGILIFWGIASGVARPSGNFVSHRRPKADEETRDKRPKESAEREKRRAATACGRVTTPEVAAATGLRDQKVKRLRG
jgi:hypothetical protein